MEAAWGAQIWNYVLQPYKMVKDGRSGWDISDAMGVLEEFIREVLRMRSRKKWLEIEEKELEK